MMLVLGYHNIGPDQKPSSWLTIPQKNFYRQLKILKQVGNFVHADDLSADLPQQANRFNILITFDDGYQGWLDYAVPVLRELNIPALFFVSTKNLVSGEPYWFERIIQYFEQGLLDQVDLSFLGLGRFTLPAHGNNSRWTEINRLLIAVKARAHELAEDEISDILGVLRERAVGEPKLTDFSCPMTSGQCGELASDPLFTIGSHSHRHRILTNLPDAEVEQELSYSRKVLEGVCGQTISTIAYPNGNYDQRIADAAVSAGYRFGFSATCSGANVDSTLCIPRRMVGSFDTQLQFGYRLTKDYITYLVNRHKKKGAV